MRIVSLLLSALVLCLVRGDVSAQTDPNAVYRMDMNADGTRFATSNVAGLTLYDAEFNQLNFRAYTSERDYLYVNPSFSPDGTRILVLNEIWDSTTLATVATLPRDSVNLAQWSPDSQMILTLPRTTQIYNAQDGRLIRELMFEQTWGFDTTFFVRAVGDQVTFTDATTGAEIANYVFPGETVGGPIWNPDGTRFALFSFRLVESGTPNSHPIDSGTRAILYSLFLVDVASGNRAHVEGLPRGIRFAAWHPDGQHLAGGTNVASLYIWDTSNLAVVESYALPPGKVIYMLKYSQTGGRLVAGLIDSSVSSNLVDTTLNATSTFSQTQLGGAFQVFAPLPSPERLQAITDACGLQPAADTALTAEISTQDYAGFTTQLEALPEDALPPGCRADLLAVAAALDAQGQ